LTGMLASDWLTHISTLAVTALVIAVAFFDLRARRIPNFLVFPAVIVGLALNASRGWHGFSFGLKGLGLGFFLLLLPYVFGGMKAGDVKFLAAIGSFVGAAEIVRVFLFTVLCYPLLAIVPVVRERKLRLTLLRFGRIFFNFLGFFVPSLKLYAQGFEARDDSGIPSVRTPFGVAIAVGTLIALYTNFLR
jgi:prepilin peptidase CpaA